MTNIFTSDIASVLNRVGDITGGGSEGESSESGGKREVTSSQSGSGMHCTVRENFAPLLCGNEWKINRY